MTMIWIAVILALSFVLYFILDKLIRSQKVDSFSQKYVLITGCDSGFGKILARRLDKMGFPVFAGCLTENGTKYFTENASSRLTAFLLDVTNTESIDNAFELVKTKIPQNSGLWALVNNAGIVGPVAGTEFSTVDGFRKTCNVNLFGPIEICIKFLRLLRKSKGRVVNIASVMGRIVCSSAPYCISKYGMEAFSDSLRREFHPFGVKVSILEPGFFKTNILDIDAMINNVETSYNDADEELRKDYGDGLVDRATALITDASENASSNFELVVDAYIHAIVSKYPRTRYIIGWDARIFFVPLTYLPTAIADWIIRTIRKRVIINSMKNKKQK